MQEYDSDAVRADQHADGVVSGGQLVLVDLKSEQRLLSQRLLGPRMCQSVQQRMPKHVRLMLMPCQ